MKSRSKHILIALLVIIAMLSAILLYLKKGGDTGEPAEETQPETEAEETGQEEEETAEAAEPDRAPKYTYTNFALIGIDSRRNNQIDYANSDTMIIASINNQTGAVRMASIYRDTLLNIGKRLTKEERTKYEADEARAESAAAEGSAPEQAPFSDDADSSENAAAPNPAVASYLEAREKQEKDREKLEAEIAHEKELDDVYYNKANAAYANGSIEQFKRMVKRNLDIEIDEYIVVDFSAVAKMIDGIGGIDVWMTKQEVIHMNNYCVETSAVTGMDYTPIDPEEEAQSYHLTGVQAVSYARIRYTAGNDYKRTQRQRVVVEKIVDKAKAHSILALRGMIFDILPNSRTSLSITDMLYYVANRDRYTIDKTPGFPFLHIGRRIYNGENTIDPIIPVTLVENVRQLHAFLYEDEEYRPSASVIRISREIKELHGFKESEYEEAERHSEIRNSGGEADVVK